MNNTNTGQCFPSGSHGDCAWWGVGALVQNVPTGLYLYGGYAENHNDLQSVALSDEARTWYLQGGIERKWFDLGKTNIFVEYRNDDGRHATLVQL